MRSLGRGLGRFSSLLLLLFILPALASLMVWISTQNLPSSWRTADWSSARIFKEASQDPEAAVYVMAARTGGTKGAFSVHSWIVTKAKHADHYNRYDKVGWGSPIRLNAYAADGRWYSNTPQIVAEYKGEQAEKLIPKIEAAIRSYPYSKHGDYTIWPGPNSNTFVAHVLNKVTEMNIVLPANAVGRDYRPIENWINIDDDWANMQISLGGYAGLSVGIRNGFELSFLGLVSGFDISKLALKIPGFGDVFFETDTAEADTP